MKHKSMMLIMLMIFMLGCGSVQPIVQSTPTLSWTSIPTLTSTPAVTPTLEPTQTQTPDVEATQQAGSFNELVVNYFDAEFLEKVNGEYYSLGDSVQNLANKGYFQWIPYDVKARNFILRTNVRMSTANKPSDSTGCGIVFRTVGNYAEFIFIQQNGYLYYGAGDTNFNSRYYGKIDNPAEFEMVLVVNDKNYDVYIDDQLALSGDFILDPSRGGVGFAVLSGSNDDFGSQCNFTKNDLWAIKSKQ